MINRSRFNSIAKCRYRSRYDRMAILQLVLLMLLLLVAAAAVDALFLMTSSHHRRRPRASRASGWNANGGGKGPMTTASSPPSEPNTKRRTTESRGGSSSPLLVFYGMVVGRRGTLGFRHHAQTENVQEQEHVEVNANANANANDDDDDEFFSKDMIQRKQEFQQRLENFRGRGRWGGYSLSGIAHHDETIQRAPLPVVSTTTIAPKSMRMKIKQQPQKRQRRRTRAPPMQQITDIQQYKKEVVDSKDSALVVVRFYACKYIR